MIIAAIATEKQGRVAKLLSENEALHRYSETEGEFFTNLIRDMFDESDFSETPPNDLQLKYYHRASRKGNAQGSILANPYLVEMYLLIWPLIDYYIDTKLFQPYWMHKKVIGRQAGVRSSESSLWGADDI